MDGEVRDFQKEKGHKSPLERAVERTRQHFMFMFGKDKVSSKNIILTMIGKKGVEQSDEKAVKRHKEAKHARSFFHSIVEDSTFDASTAYSTA